MNGKVSKTQVRRVSWGLIPDQAQQTNTIINKMIRNFFDVISYFLSASYSLCVNYLKPQKLDHRIEIPVVMQ